MRYSKCSNFNFSKFSLKFLSNSWICGVFLQGGRGLQLWQVKMKDTKNMCKWIWKLITVRRWERSLKKKVSWQESQKRNLWKSKIRTIDTISRSNLRIMWGGVKSPPAGRISSTFSDVLSFKQGQSSDWQITENLCHHTMVTYLFLNFFYLNVLWGFLLQHL